MNTFQYKLLKDFGALKKGDVVAKSRKMGKLRSNRRKTFRSLEKSTYNSLILWLN